ncbi:unnamed protein product [Heligmosomoides polygyrus]|uniref:Pentatricopeptide repeat-containing protein n=1 Tax=Heligmosomoides polygyrus TaxID=6339 RepID=A0A183GM01_HELPZ|nr:unnamed protein product [Heligmosomoides polygyrus]
MEFRLLYILSKFVGKLQEFSAASFHASRCLTNVFQGFEGDPSMNPLFPRVVPQFSSPFAKMRDGAGEEGNFFGGVIKPVIKKIAMDQAESFLDRILSDESTKDDDAADSQEAKEGRMGNRCKADEGTVSEVRKGKKSSGKCNKAGMRKAPEVCKEQRNGYVRNKRTTREKNVYER